MRLEPKTAQPFSCSSGTADNRTEQCWRWGKALPEGTVASLAQLTLGAGACPEEPATAGSERAGRLMCHICNATATMPSASSPAKQSLPQLACRYSAFPKAGSLSAWPQEWFSFLAPRQHRSVCWWTKQMHRSNSTQKRAVVLADRHAGGRVVYSPAARLSQPADRTLPVSWHRQSRPQSCLFHTLFISLCSHFLPLTH